MKTFWQGQVKQSIKYKKGSSMVMLGIIFTAFAICIMGAIGVARMLTVRSECEVFGRVWTKAILSEYDKHLIDDYGIMAYFGNEADVQRKLDLYLKYSSANKLAVSIGDSSSELYGYELGDPKNFRKALNSSLLPSMAESIINGNKRTKRFNSDDENFGSRNIRDGVVISTLPSDGIKNTFDIQDFIENSKAGISSPKIFNEIKGLSAELAFIKKYFGSAVTSTSDKPCYFQNEMEYVLIGKLDDGSNQKSIKRRLFLIRNSLNLTSLYKDPDKLKLIVSAAEIITPGPGGVITQALIAEAWALCETESDMNDLYADERVPLIKSKANWETSLGSVLNSDALREKLDEESVKNLDENGAEINTIGSLVKSKGNISDGLSYDEYLMLMIMSLNDNVRLLRIMDIIQINMKYRYYRDFNMTEYFIGVRFSINANGRSYDFEDSYK